jgi:uncharacterized protein YecT (DUF1311 family)
MDGVRYFLACTTILVGIPLAQAQDAGAQRFDACMNAAGGVSSEMLNCGKQEIDQWDTRLNAAYRTLSEHARADEKTKLRNEQRAWLKHHLQETHRLAADPNNGSVAFLDSQAFELGDIKNRTLELERRVKISREVSLWIALPMRSDVIE